MADEEVATRAPESDAIGDNTRELDSRSQNTSAANDTAAAASEQAPASTVSSTADATSAQNDSAMSEHCTSDRPIPASANPPAGEVSSLNGVACYISKPSNYPHNPGKLLLLLTGGTGIKSINNQLQADAYASRGFLVVMPDQFSGDVAPNIGILSDEEAKERAEMESENSNLSSLLERIKLGVAEAAKSFIIDMWLARHTPEKVLPIINKAIEGAKESFGDAVANGGGIYGVGYCFGAKYILIFCGNGSEMDKQPQSPSADSSGEADANKSKTVAPTLKTGVIAHGTLITKEDIENVRSPVCMACVAGDSLFPDDVREQGRATLELNAVDHEIRVYPDVPHGFAVLGDYADSRISERQVEAFELMCSWLESH